MFAQKRKLADIYDDTEEFNYSEEPLSPVLPPVTVPSDPTAIGARPEGSSQHPDSRRVIGGSFPVGVCVAVKSLRPRYKDLEQWYHTEGNVLVTRHGRVSVGDKKVFVYPESPWANPFKLSEYSLEDALRKFGDHLDAKLKDPAMKRRFMALAHAKEIGCFCPAGAQCHRNVILNKLAHLMESESLE